MPCQLSGARYQDFCCCYKLSDTMHTGRAYPKKKLFTRAVESFYENCAAYNLRHIPYRTVTDRGAGACLRNTVKDLFVLFCFVAANSVVLLTILSKIAMHLAGVMLDAVDWFKKKSDSKPSQNQKRLLALVYSGQSQSASVARPCPQVPQPMPIPCDR